MNVDYQMNNMCQKRSLSIPLSKIGGMRVFVYFMMLLFALPHLASAQRKVNKMNGLAQASDKKKKHNKQWIKMRTDGIPSFMVSVGIEGGQANFQTSETNIVLRDPYTILNAPHLNIHINPTKNFGITAGFMYRRTSLYYGSEGIFQNDSISATANGEWEQHFGNVGFNFGLCYYGTLAKKVLSCTGYGRVTTPTIHFYLEPGIIFAPSLYNEVFFKGDYVKLANGELRESENFQEFTIMYTNEPRRDPMLFGYAKVGLRFQSDDFATRIGPYVEYQLNENRGLVNDFTPNGTSLLNYGLHMSFEFY